ncbi:MAG: hypothetical protein IJT47_02565 [Selenomonadaceae bacterium]|nr:hypothetical protein [Selenomonadaceae bacterium]
MFVIRKRQPAQVLTALEEYLRGADELVEVVTREALSWSEISYAELEELIAAGRLNDFINWQEKYSALVNEKLAPAMIAAAIAAAKKSTSNKIIISDSDELVKLWIRNHGAELVGQLSAESRRAIANILLIWQERLMQPRTMARQIRPLIGLNDRQASAVDNYRRRIYNRYIEGGLNPQSAGERADKAALKYSLQQHARRAETIVHTELAFAYNRGAHEGVTRAINAKLMPHCEMVWTTAGTNRVCGRCMELKDTVVGRTDEGGVQIPPLHPRCRCTIMYRELVGGGNKTINDCKNFDELATYWQKNYGVAIQGTVKQLEFGAVKEASAGWEAALNLIPSTRQYLKEIQTKRGRGWLFAYNYDNHAVVFNKDLFQPDKIAQTLEGIKYTWEQGIVSRNATIKSMAAHEIGHAANLALTEALGLSVQNTYINQVGELFVKDVFASLPKDQRKEGLEALRLKISKVKKYAQKKSETLAEALDDFIANGQRATPFSKALVNQIEAAISSPEFLTKHILSQDYSKLRKTFGLACLDDITVRKWYIYHDERIHELIDSSLSLEQKAHQAFDLRNEYRTQARDLMQDRKKRAQLDLQYPNPSWEDILRHKMADKGMTKEQALEDIFKTAMKSNAKVNRSLGLE